MIKWDSDFPAGVQNILVEKLKKIHPGKGCAWPSIEFEEILAILLTVLGFDKIVPNQAKANIITKGIFKTKKEALTTETLIAAINDAQKDFLCRKPKKYYLITSLSLQNTIEIPSFNINGSHISFKARCGNKEAKERETKISELSKWLFREYPKNYLYVRIATEGKDYYAAVRQALDAVDFLRGIWNLYLNSLTVIGDSYGKFKPLNKITLGPLHTLHIKTGKCVENVYWYESAFNDKSLIFRDKERFSDSLKFTEKIRKKIKNLPEEGKYRWKVTEAIIRFCRALDICDYEVAFIKLWSVLELLTNTIKIDNIR